METLRSKLEPIINEYLNKYSSDGFIFTDTILEDVPVITDTIIQLVADHLNISIS